MPNRPQSRICQALFITGAALWIAGKHHRPQRSMLWSALLLAADLAAIPAILRAKPAIQDAEIDAIDQSAVPAIDRIALRLPIERREAIRKSSDQMLRLLVAAPLLFLFNKRLRHRAASWLQDYVWGHALTYTIYTFSPIGPAFVDKYRPIVYRSGAPLKERDKGNNRNSQYSGHTGNAAFASFFAARLFAQIQPANSGLKEAGFGLAALAALILGSLRVRAQKHFPSDVLLAGGIGAAAAAAAFPGALVTKR
jgi:hypothetical protein